MMRRVIFLVSHSSAGGAQEVWANLAEAFLNRGDQVTLMALYPLRTTVRETPLELPWRYVVDQRPLGPLSSLKMLIRLVDIVRREDPDLLVTALPAANILAAIAARIAGKTSCVVISHHSPTDTHNPLLDRLDGITGSLGSVKAVVSVSNSVSSTLSKKPEQYLAKRRTIHNALPPAIEQLLTHLSAQRANNHKRGRKVVATGRLAHQKNYPLLIRAAVHMPDVDIDIVGNGPDESALKSLSRDLGVSERVRFLGHRPRPEALEILANGDLFVQVSHFEGHSLALIEAAKLGIPLVVSDVPVQIEGITRSDGVLCGITVAMDDDFGLAQAITRLLNDPVIYGAYVEMARRLAEEATFEGMVDGYRALLVD